MGPGGHILRATARDAARSTGNGGRRWERGHQAGNRVLRSGPGEESYARVPATYLRGEQDEELARAGRPTMSIAALFGGATNRWRSTLASGTNSLHRARKNDPRR
jgi:hypothetical protein